MGIKRLQEGNQNAQPSFKLFIVVRSYSYIFANKTIQFALKKDHYRRPCTSVTWWACIV